MGPRCTAVWCFEAILVSNKVYLVFRHVVISRNSRRSQFTQIKGPNFFWSKMKKHFYLYIDIYFIYTVDRYILTDVSQVVENFLMAFDCGYLQISVKFRNVTNKPFKIHLSSIENRLLSQGVVLMNTFKTQLWKKGNKGKPGCFYPKKFNVNKSQLLQQTACQHFLWCWHSPPALL